MVKGEYKLFIMVVIRFVVWWFIIVLKFGFGKIKYWFEEMEEFFFFKFNLVVGFIFFLVNVRDSFR